MFPKWLNAVFGRSPTPYKVQWVHEYVGQPTATRSYQQRSINETVKSVCRTCNNGWMARLEAAARPVLTPLIRGERSGGISPAEQLQIATWASMKAAVAEDLGGRRVIQQEQRDALRLAGSPPSTSRVHLAHYKGSTGPLLFQRILGQAPPDHDLVPGQMAGATALVLGQLAVLVYFGPVAHYNSAASFGEYRAEWISVWPPLTPEAPWPPARPVDERGALELLAGVMPGSGVDVDDLLHAWDPSSSC